MSAPRKRLIEARARSAKTPEQVATAAGLLATNYYDLELCDDEIVSAISIRDLNKLCSVLGVTLRELFGVSAPTLKEKNGFSNLAMQVQEYLKTHGVSPMELEEKVGWELDGFLHDPETAWQWTVDALRDVCREIGVDWGLVLAKLE